MSNPKTNSVIQNTSFRLRMSKKLRLAVVKAARQLGMSCSEFVRAALREKLDATLPSKDRVY